MSPNAIWLATRNLNKIPSILFKYFGPGIMQLLRETLGPDLNEEFPQILNFVVTPDPSRNEYVSGINFFEDS